MSNVLSKIEPRTAQSWRQQAANRLRLGDVHAWLIVAGCCDFVLTMMVLGAGGSEANPLADGVLRAGGAWAMALYKAICCAVIIGGCEWIARRRADLASRLAWAMLLLWTLPPVYGAAGLLWLTYGG